jgi:hypothetical protein
LPFHTWAGDCHPASYFGHDARGRVVCLVADTFLQFHAAGLYEEPG